MGTVSLGLSGGEELRGVIEKVWLGSHWAWQWLSGVRVPSPALVPPFTSLPRGVFHLLSFLLHLGTPQAQFPWVGSAGGKEGGAENSRCLRVRDISDLGSCLQRSCSNCGNSFCSRCCSFKVPKSSMGATGEWCRWWEGLVGIPPRGCHVVAKGQGCQRSRELGIVVRPTGTFPPSPLAKS